MTGCIWVCGDETGARMCCKPTSGVLCAEHKEAAARLLEQRDAEPALRLVRDEDEEPKDECEVWPI